MKVMSYESTSVKGTYSLQYIMCKYDRFNYLFSMIIDVTGLIFVDIDFFEKIML